MNTRTIAVLIVSSLLIVGAGLFMLTAGSDKEPEQTDVLSAYTLDDVKDHNKKDDCWTIINNSVYDITSYVPRHPGGDEILEACGEDATTLFTQRVDEDGEEVGSGTPHSSSAEQQLEQLKIGTLTQ